MTARTPVEYRRTLRIAGALVGIATALGACTHTDEVATTASVPTTIACGTRSRFRNQTARS